MRILSLVAAALVSMVLATAAQAQATIDIEQDGLNVVATLSGSIDTTGLTYLGLSTETGYGLTGAAGQVFFDGYGQAGDAYSGVTGPESFGTGAYMPFFVAAGSEFIWDSANLILPEGYLSGTSLTATGFYDNTTIAALGLTPGTYVYSWNPGPSDGSFIVQIGDAMPEPASLPLIATGLAALAALSCGRRARPTLRD
jgi:hypothetical protein